MSDSLSNKELVAVGHHFAKAMSSDTAIMDIAKIVSRLAERLDCTTAALRATQDQRDQLAAENAVLKSAIETHSESIHFCELCGKDDPCSTDDVCMALSETPVTDAFLAEVRAHAIPEGYTLLPQQIFLEPSDIESICSQCGDGHESGYGDFTDGLLWVGNIQRDDGSIVYGLHISSADYSEEGGVTVCEFAAQLHQDANTAELVAAGIITKVGE